ncbi:MAG: hypothetical protein VSS52_008260 [Thiotrichaceae bacterium]|nr:hypothetical protein [Thiotrichaceae bacterium]
MQNKFENTGDISGASINVGGNHVNQSIQTSVTSTDDRNLSQLLQILAAKIDKVEDQIDRQAAQQQLNVITEQVEKRDKTLLQKAVGVIENIVGAVNEIREIKTRLLG